MKKKVPLAKTKKKRTKRRRRRKPIWNVDRLGFSRIRMGKFHSTRKASKKKKKKEKKEIDSASRFLFFLEESGRVGVVFKSR